MLISCNTKNSNIEMNYLPQDTLGTKMTIETLINDSNNVSVFLSCDFTGEIQIFDESNRVIKTVKNNLERENIVMFDLLDKKDKMFYVLAYWALDSEIIAKGWIYKNNHLGIFSAAYNVDLLLFKEPYNRKINIATDKEYNPQIYEVIDFEGKWLKIKAKINNETYKGWISPEMQCSNVYFTCN